MQNLFQIFLFFGKGRKIKMTIRIFDLQIEWRPYSGRRHTNTSVLILLRQGVLHHSPHNLLIIVKMLTPLESCCQ